MKEVQVQAIIFQGDRVEITYAETRDQTEHIQMAKIIACDRDAIAEQLDILEDLAIELANDMLLIQRNPPAVVPERILRGGQR